MKHWLIKEKTLNNVKITMIKIVYISFGDSCFYLIHQNSEDKYISYVMILWVSAQDQVTLDI